ncbi:MAG: hypothetical protein M9941_01370 [Anaerolineae bacterium]|nr:hypothetical protein [Anaerolineae bacterium]
MAERLFEPDQQLITKARSVFAKLEQLYWVIGGAASGKSTICAALAARFDVELIDMDARTYGSFFGRYDPVRHPASTAWLSAENPLAYLLNMTWAQFDSYNRTTQTECLDLLADELAELPTNRPLLVDGGITHPSLLVQSLSAEKIVCLSASNALRIHEWETAENRAEMRNWVTSLPNGDAMWQKFLQFDRLMTATMLRESHTTGIVVFERNAATSVDTVSHSVATHFGLTQTGGAPK